jgi:hypothetical protein
MIETDKTPLTVKPVTRGKVDPNTIAPDFPDASVRPDTIFHGGSGKSLPPADNRPSKKLSADLLGEDTHNAHGSYEHLAGMNDASQPPPQKANSKAPKVK